MSGSEVDIATWARLHKVCYEVAPLIEMDKDQKVQVGYTLDFYARLPVDKPPGPERREAAVKIWERMREIVQSFAPSTEGPFPAQDCGPPLRSLSATAEPHGARDPAERAGLSRRQLLHCSHRAEAGQVVSV